MTPRIAIGPQSAGFARHAVRQGGGEPVEVGQDAEGLVWLESGDVTGLRSVLDAGPGISWVQLPSAGVEKVAAAGLFHDGRTWTSAKGAYAPPVAEHALALALAGLRQLPLRLAARSWGEQGGRSLHGADVTILGAGGITVELLRLLEPFGTRATVVRRRPDPLPGAVRTVGLDRVDEVLGGARVVFLALALTDATRGIIAAPQLAAMDDEAWLVNVARGGHVVTDDLVVALGHGTIAGAGLDVTDPEPLPDGHPLWDLPTCIITPHTADTDEMVRPLLGARIAANVAHLVAGEPFEALVDGDAGY